MTWTAALQQIKNFEPCMTLIQTCFYHSHLPIPVSITIWNQQQRVCNKITFIHKLYMAKQYFYRIKLVYISHTFLHTVKYRNNNIIVTLPVNREVRIECTWNFLTSSEYHNNTYTLFNANCTMVIHNTPSPCLTFDTLIHWI